MSTVTSLRMRVLPRFPARISGTNGLTVDVQSPDLIIKPDFGALAEIVTVESTTDTYFWVWRAGLDEYDRISFQMLVDGIGSIIIGPNLIGLASISSAADKVPYFIDNAGNASSYTVSSYVRGVSGAVNGPAYLAAIGAATTAQGALASTALQPAAIGSSVQAFDTDLTAIAALTSAANKVPYSTGSGAWALTEFTAAGRAIVGAADVAAQRTALALGGSAVLNVGTSAVTVAAGDDKRFRDDQLNLLMYSPSLANGADVSAAFQALFTAAAAAKKSAYIPAHPSGFDWRISAAVSIPDGCRIVIGPTATIITSASIDLFTCAGNNITIDGSGFGMITHDGAGAVLNCNQKDGIRFTRVFCNVAGSGDAFKMTGSDTYIEDCRFGTFRTSDYLFAIVKNTGHIVINNRIDRCYFGGTGRVLRVGTTDGSNRPEGWSLSDCKSVATGSTVINLESFLYGTITDSVLDQGSNIVINIAASGAGISSLDISGNYIASAFGAGQTTGVAINTVDNAILIKDLRIVNNTIGFSGYGFIGKDNVVDALIAENAFTVIAANGISGPADDWTMRDNSYTSVFQNVALTEGSGGGSITISNESYDPAGTISLPATLTRDRWNISRTFGKLLRRHLNATGSSLTNGQYVYIPHGLIRAPDPKALTGLMAFAISGTYGTIKANVAAVDATNVTVQVWFESVVTPGNILISLDASV